MIKDLYKVHRYSDYENHSDDEFTNPNFNPINDLLIRAEHKYHFRSEESGLFHPFTKANVKLKNSGSLDVFVENETGVRLDPFSQSIVEFGNSKKSNLYSLMEWINGDKESYVGGNQKTKVYGTTDFYGKKKVSLECDDEMSVKVLKDIKIDGQSNIIIQIGGNQNITIKGDSNIEIIGNVNAKVEGHAKIDINGDIDMHSGRDIRINAERDITIDAARHLHTIWRCPDPSHYNPDIAHK